MDLPCLEILVLINIYFRQFGPEQVFLDDIIAIVYSLTYRYLETFLSHSFSLHFGCYSVPTIHSSLAYLSDSCNPEQYLQTRQQNSFVLASLSQPATVIQITDFKVICHQVKPAWPMIRFSPLLYIIIAMKRRTPMPTVQYRFLTKNQKWLWLAMKAFSFINPFSQQVEYVVCTNVIMTR